MISVSTKQHPAASHEPKWNRVKADPDHAPDNCDRCPMIKPCLEEKEHNTPQPRPKDWRPGKPETCNCCNPEEGLGGFTATLSSGHAPHRQTPTNHRCCSGFSSDNCSANLQPSKTLDLIASLEEECEALERRTGSAGAMAALLRTAAGETRELVAGLQNEED